MSFYSVSGVSSSNSSVPNLSIQRNSDAIQRADIVLRELQKAREEVNAEIANKSAQYGLISVGNVFKVASSFFVECVFFNEQEKQLDTEEISTFASVVHLKTLDDLYDHSPRFEKTYFGGTYMIREEAATRQVSVAKLVKIEECFAWEPCAL